MIEIKRDFSVRREDKGRKTVKRDPSPSGDGAPRVARLMALAIHFEGLVSRGEVADYAELALAVDDEAGRNAFLDEVCENTELRRRADAAIDAHAQLGSFLEQPAGGFDATVEFPGLDEPGRMIGPYKLKERLGAGGMGVVWVAEQKQPLRRKVALKVIKPGMDSEQILARFEAEREALSLMDHPNIAQVLDAGTTPQGRPFFVMELIRGVPITEFCDARKMPVEDRLRIFTQVCRAVQHAHQKGVIHRDIKPLNVLVTEKDGQPVPKVIDFGVAKALHQPLTDRSIYSGLFQAIGTFAYMSPEQAGLSSSDVDSRADVYGLGALLYELLTGMTPFDKKQLAAIAFDEACRVIRDKDPPRPSVTISTLGDRAVTISEGRGTNAARLGQLMKGELDLIVMKALEKDRGRRYDSASSFADDISRYLAGDEVSVSPPSQLYRLQRFYRRNKIKVAVGLTLAIILLVASTVSTTLAVQLSWTTADLEKSNQQLRTSQKELADVNYARAIMTAYHEWDNANPEAAVQILQEIQSKSAEWGIAPGVEWNLLWRRILRDYAEFGGKTLSPTNMFVQMGYSDDSRRLAVPVPESGVHIHDLLTNEKVVLAFEKKGEEELAQPVSIVHAPDSRLVIGLETGPDQGRIVVCNKRGEIAEEISVDFEPWRLRFSPDGVQLLAGSRYPARIFKFALFNASDWRPLWKKALYYDSVEFLADNRLLTTHNGRVLRVWDIRTGTELKRKETPFRSAARAGLTPNGSALLTTSESSTVVWDPDLVEVRAIAPAVVGSIAFDFSHQASHMFARQRSRRVVDIHEWETSTFVRNVQEKVDIERLAISPDGSHLATISLFGRVKLWELGGARQAFTRAHPHWFIPLAPHPDGKRVAMAFDLGSIKIWNPLTGQEQVIANAHEKYAAGIAFSPSGRFLATGGRDGRVRLWNAESGKLIKEIAENLDPTWVVAFSHDDKLLASGGRAGRIRVWDVASGSLKHEFVGEEGQVIRGIDFLPSGRRLVSCGGVSGHGALRLWTLATEESEMLHKTEFRVDSVQVSPDGKWIAAADRSGFLLLYSSETKELMLKTKVAGSYVASVRFTSDSTRLVCAALGEISIYQVPDGREIARWTNTDSVRQVAVMPNDMALVTAGYNGVVRYWPMNAPMVPETAK